jgi:excisionase family DNA binding protein
MASAVALFSTVEAMRTTILSSGTDPSVNAPARMVLSVPEAARVLGISRAFAYELVARGELPHVRLGRRVVVPVKAVERVLARAFEEDGASGLGGT